MCRRRTLRGGKADHEVFGDRGSRSEPRHLLTPSVYRYCTCHSRELRKSRRFDCEANRFVLVQAEIR
jgi:hypothetical protein